MAYRILQLLDNVCPSFLHSQWSRLKTSPTGYRLARGAFWSLTGSVVARGMGLLSGIFVARLLGKHAFGEMEMIQSTVGLFGTVAGFGTGVMATRNVAELRLKDPLRAGRIIGLSSATTWVTSGIMALVLVILAPWLAVKFLAAPQLAGLLRVGALLLLLGGVNGAQTGALCGFEAFRRTSYINLLTGLVSFPMMVLGGWFWGIAGALWGLVGNYAFNCCMNWHALRKEAEQAGITVSYADCWRERKLFWHYNLPTLLNSILYTFTTWACGAMLVQQAGGYADMGLLGAAKRFAELPGIFVGMLLAPVLPILSENFGRKDMAAYGKTLVLTYVTCALVVVPVSLLQIAAPWLTFLPYGADYTGGGTTARWILTGSIVGSLVLPMNSILISMGRMGLWLLLGGSYVALYLGLGWWLIPRYGAVGYAMSATISFAVSHAPFVVFLYNHLGHVMRRVKWFTMFLLVCALLCVCWFAPGLTKNSLTLAVGLAAAAIFCVWRWLTFRAGISKPAVA